MKRISILLAAFALAACATTSQSPQATLAQVTSGYNAAAQIIIAYKRLPPCPAVTALCKKPEIVKQLQDADTVAYNALVAAEQVARSPNAGANPQTAIAAANAALQALVNIANQLQVQP